MLFKKKNEATKNAVAQARRQILDGIQAQIDTANSTTDVAERLVKLDEIRSTIATVVSENETNIERNVSSKLIASFLGGTVATTAVGAVLAIQFAFPPTALILLLTMPGILSVSAGEPMARNARQTAIAEIHPFFAALNAKKDTVTDGIDAAIHGNIKYLAASSRFCELQAKPGLCDSFVAALRKEVVKPQEPAPEPKRTVGGLSL